MTNISYRKLGIRAVLCKHFRWMDGMKILDALGEPYRIKWVNGDSLECDDDDCLRMPYDGIIPDLSDPATIGCMLSLVREAWRDDGIAATIVRDARDGDYWKLLPVEHAYPAFASTEAQALVEALEAAP